MKALGVITLISGPMFAGKSEELINEYFRLTKEGKVPLSSVLLVKPKRDKRNETISSRTGRELTCKLVEKPQEIAKLANAKIKYVLLDEFQFFGTPLVKVVNQLKQKGKNVILAGLNKNFKRIDFPVYAELVEVADFQISITARCHDCGRVAKYSRKLIDGQPAKRTSSTIEIELENVTYKAVCSKCHK